MAKPNPAVERRLENNQPKKGKMHENAPEMATIKDLFVSHTMKSGCDKAGEPWSGASVRLLPTRFHLRLNHQLLPLLLQLHPKIS